MTSEYFREHYAGEYIGYATSRDEDLVPALIEILRHLDKDGELSSGAQDDLARYDAAWDAGEWDPDDTDWLIDLVETNLPPFAAMDISGQWADSGLRLYIIGEESDADEI